MSESRKAKFKGKSSLMHSADQKRQAWDVRNKKNRERAMDTKRMIVLEGGGPADTTLALQHLFALLEGDVAVEPSAEPHLDYLIQFINNPDSEVHFLLENGLISLLERCLIHGADTNKIQAAKCITGVASGDHSQTSQLFPLIPSVLVVLQSHASADLKTQLCWALGNIAVDCNVCKTTLTQFKCPQQVIMLLLQSIERLAAIRPLYATAAAAAAAATTWDRPAFVSQASVISNLLWTLTSMVRGPVDVGYLQDLPDPQMLQLLSLMAVDDDCIKPMARWLFIFLTTKDQALFDRLLALGLFDHVMARVAAELPDEAMPLGNSTDSQSQTRYADEDDEAQVSLIRCLGNLCAGNEVCAQRAAAFVNRLVVCLDSESHSKYTVREALRTLSYVLNGASEAQQHAALGKSHADFVAFWHQLVVSSDYEGQEAALLAMESLHPSVCLQHYGAHRERLQAVLFAVVKLTLSHTTTTLGQIGGLVLLKTWAASEFVAEELARMDVAESLENLHYTSEEVAVTTLAQEVTDLIYQHMEGQETAAAAAESSLPVPENVFAFAAPSGPGTGAGRGMLAVQPAWMSAQTFQF